MIIISILYITGFFPSNSEPFRGHFIEKQAKIMSDKINQDLIVFKISFNGRSTNKSITLDYFNEIPVYTIQFPNLLKGISAKNSVEESYKYFKNKIDAIFKGNEPTVIMSNDEFFSIILGNMIKTNYKACHVCIIHGEDTNLLNKITQNKKIINSELHKCDKVIAVSNKIKSYLKNNFKFNDDIIVSGNGLSNGVIEKYRNYNFPKSKELMLVSVANINYNKGIDIVVKALSKFNKPFTYYIIGDGPYKQKLMKQIKKYGLNNKVKFIGNINNEEVYSYLEQSHFFILPSRNEAFGIVYIESMITANICIGSQGQGCEDFIDDGVNGFLVNNPDQIVDILNKYSERDDIDDIVYKARATALQYSWENNVNNILNNLDVYTKSEKLKSH